MKGRVYMDINSSSAYDEWLKLRGAIDYSMSCILLGANAEIMLATLNKSLDSFENGYLLKLLEKRTSRLADVKEESAEWCEDKSPDAASDMKLEELKVSETSAIIGKISDFISTKTSETDKASEPKPKRKYTRHKNTEDKESNSDSQMTLAGLEVTADTESEADSSEPEAITEQGSTVTDKPAVEPASAYKNEKVDETLSVFQPKLTAEERSAFDEAILNKNGLISDFAKQKNFLEHDRVLASAPISQYYIIKNRNNVVTYVELNITETKKLGNCLMWRVLKGSEITGITSKLNYSDDYLNFRNAMIKCYAERKPDKGVFKFTRTTDWIMSTADWMGCVILGNYNSLVTRLSVVDRDAIPKQ